MDTSVNRITLKRLTPQDVTQAYVDWMNDEEAVQYLESRYNKHSIDDVKEYVAQVSNSKDHYLFGIFCRENNLHIGNIKIGSINHFHGFADVGLIIGNKGMWGKGIATEAIALVTDYAFNGLKLNKLIAGIYANNIGSYKAFIKCGWKDAALLKKHRLFKNEYVDEIIVEKIKGE